MNSIEMSLNLKSLKMIDKSAVRIIDMSFRVAMFDFDVYKNKYNNCDKSGTMFVYERSSLPTYAFALLNTKNLQNAIEYLERGFESCIQAERNICFKTTKTELKLLYFFEVKDVNRINNLFWKLCQAESPEIRDNFQSLHEEHTNSNQFLADKILNHNKKTAGSKTNTNVNLVEMLNKAQTMYEQKSLPTSTAPQTSQLRLGNLFNRPSSQQPTTSSWSQPATTNRTVLPESAISVTELERQQHTAVGNRVPKAIENTALNKLFKKPETFQNVLQKHDNQHEISKSVPLNIPKPNVSQTHRKTFDSTCLLKNFTWNGQPSNQTMFSSSSKPKATKTNSLSPTFPSSSSHLNDNFKNLLSNDLVKVKNFSHPKTSVPLVKKTAHINPRDSIIESLANINLSESHKQAPIRLMSPVDFIPKTEKNTEKSEPNTPLSMKDMIESVIHLLKSDSAFQTDFYNAYLKSWHADNRQNTFLMQEKPSNHIHYFK